MNTTITNLFLDNIFFSVNYHRYLNQRPNHSLSQKNQYLNLNLIYHSLCYLNIIQNQLTLTFLKLKDNYGNLFNLMIRIYNICYFLKKQLQKLKQISRQNQGNMVSLHARLWNIQTIIYNVNRTQHSLNIIVKSITNNFNRKMSDDSEQYTIQSQPKRNYKKLTERTKERLRQKVFSENMTVARAARNLKVKQSASKVYVRKIKDQIASEMKKAEQNQRKMPQSNEKKVQIAQNYSFTCWNYYPIFIFTPNQNQIMRSYD